MNILIRLSMHIAIVIWIHQLAKYYNDLLSLVILQLLIVTLSESKKVICYDFEKITIFRTMIFFRLYIAKIKVPNKSHIHYLWYICSQVFSLSPPNMTFLTILSLKNIVLVKTRRIILRLISKILNLSRSFFVHKK